MYLSLTSSAYNKLYFIPKIHIRPKHTSAKFRGSSFRSRYISHIQDCSFRYNPNTLSVTITFGMIYFAQFSKTCIYLLSDNLLNIHCGVGCCGVDPTRLLSLIHWFLNIVVITLDFKKKKKG